MRLSFIFANRAIIIISKLITIKLQVDFQCHLQFYVHILFQFVEMIVYAENILKYEKGVFTKSKPNWKLF